MRINDDEVLVQVGICGLCKHGKGKHKVVVFRSKVCGGDTRVAICPYHLRRLLLASRVRVNVPVMDGITDDTKTI